MVAAQLLDQRAHLADLARVQADRRLVEDDHRRVVEHGLGDADALPQPLRESADQLVGTVAEVDLLHRALDRRGAVGDPVQPRHEVQIAPHGHLRIDRRGLGKVAYGLAGGHRLGDDIVAGDEGAPARGRQVAGQDAHGGGLACAVWAEEAHDLSAIGAEGDLLQRGRRTVVAREVIDLDHHLSRVPGRHSGTSRLGNKDPGQAAGVGRPDIIGMRLLDAIASVAGDGARSAEPNTVLHIAGLKFRADFPGLEGWTQPYEIGGDPRAGATRCSVERLFGLGRVSGLLPAPVGLVRIAPSSSSAVATHTTISFRLPASGSVPRRIPKRRRLVVGARGPEPDRKPPGARARQIASHSPSTCENAP